MATPPAQPDAQRADAPALAPLALLTADDLMRMTLAPARWVVPGLLPQGLTLLAGKPKMGKSWLALDLAGAVASAGMLLGRHLVDSGDVLYLALEDTPRRLQQRLTQLLGDATAPHQLGLATACARLDEGGEKQIAQWLCEHPSARLVILDTLAKVRPPARAGSTLYQDDYGAVGGLKRLADQAGVAILLVHHLRKLDAADPLDEISGTTGLTGAVDGLMVLRRQRANAHAALHLSGRDLEDQELALAWEASTCRWTVAPETDGASRSQERTAMLEVLRRAAPAALMPHEVAQQLGKPSEAVRQLLPKMARDGEITKTSRGRYQFPQPSHAA